jgi:hypothetical protein
MVLVGWGEEAAYDPELVRRSVSTYRFIAMREPATALSRGTSARSRCSFVELVVDPKFQRRGVVHGCSALTSRAMLGFR